jgi:hypothetical protein
VDGPVGFEIEKYPMRIIFGLMSLVAALAIVSTLAKKQFSAASDIKMPQVTGTGIAPLAVDPNASVKQQSQQTQQTQQQYKKAIEDALQQAKPMPDDK